MEVVEEVVGGRGTGYNREIFFNKCEQVSPVIANNVSLPLDCISDCRECENLMIYNRARKNLAMVGVEEIKDERGYIDLKKNLRRAFIIVKYNMIIVWKVPSSLLISKLLFH